MGITVTGCRPCFGDNILKLTVVMDAQLCEYSESQWIVHLSMWIVCFVNFIFLKMKECHHYWSMDMKRIIKEYYNQVHADKFNNLDENGPIPWKIEIYQSSHKEIGNLNRLISS